MSSQLSLLHDPILDKPIVTTAGLICTYLSSLIVPPVLAFVGVTAFIDEYGVDFLKAINAKCKILILDSKAYNRHRRLLDALTAESWTIIPTVIKTHSKFYTSIYSKEGKYCAYVLLGSANLAMGEILCHSVNNVEVYHGCIDDKGLFVEWLGEKLQAYLTPDRVEEVKQWVASCL